MGADAVHRPTTERSLAEYFKQRLEAYAQTLRPPPHEDTRWYVGALLDRYGRSEQLFVWEDGELSLRPLAQLYGDAREARDERERCLILRQLGDLALFLGALFPDRYARRGIRRDYFVGMGSGAFGYLADNARGDRHVFREIADAFTRVLAMIEHACADDRTPDDAEVLALYRRWVEHRDPFAEYRLRRAGIALDRSERLH